MESTRQKKVARLLEKDLGDIFQRHLQEITKKGMVSITKVTISPDLGFAKVYLSLFLIEDKEAFLFEVKENSKQIRQMLAKRVRHQLRIVPELAFYVDDTQEETDKINRLFDSLEIPPENDQDLSDYNL